MICFIPAPRAGLYLGLLGTSAYSTIRLLGFAWPIPCPPALSTCDRFPVSSLSWGFFDVVSSSTLVLLHSSLESLYCRWRLSSGAISRVLTFIISVGLRAASTDPVLWCPRSDKSHLCQSLFISKRFVAFMNVSAAMTAVISGLHFAFSSSAYFPSRRLTQELFPRMRQQMARERGRWKRCASVARSKQSYGWMYGWKHCVIEDGEDILHQRRIQVQQQRGGGFEP